jgi:tyrosine-protein kinase Etk/Wzc
VIGNRAGAIFLLARASVTTDAEVTESVKRLNHAGLSPQGVLFNNMTHGIGGYHVPFLTGPIGQLGA